MRPIRLFIRPFVSSISTPSRDAIHFNAKLRFSSNHPPPPLPAACWSCKVPASMKEIFCAGCGVLQPLRTQDYFSLLSMPRQYDLSLVVLDKRYKMLHKRVHPDKFADSHEEAHLSQSYAAEVNEAYETLKDPLKRSIYMLGLSGMEFGKEGDVISSPATLMEVMETRLELEDSRDDPVKLKKLKENNDKHIENRISEISEAFEAQDLHAALKATTQLSYLRTIGEELTRLLPVE